MKHSEIKGITIYCGSSGGTNPAFTASAEATGRAIAAAGLPLIYGGGHMGMMGAAARAARAAGGETIAVIPQFMVERGWNDPEATETVITPDMHRRKELMAGHAMGAIALPGGIGTFEELTELITWRQLGLYTGNIVILNMAGYYDSLLAMFGHAMKTGFMPSDHTALWHVSTDAAEAVAAAAAATSELHLKAKF